MVMSKSSFRKDILEEICKAVKVSKRKKTLTKKVLNNIPQEALEVLKDQKEFFEAFKYVLTRRGKSTTEDIYMYFLAKEFLKKLNFDTYVFGKEVLNNSKEFLFLSSLAYAGYLKHSRDYFFGIKKIKVAYIVKKYRSLENLEERIQEAEEWYKLYSFYNKTGFTRNRFVFLVEKVYGLKIETYDGKEVNHFITNVNNAEEINKVISFDIEAFKRQGEEIVNELIKKFPSLENDLNYLKRHSFIILLGAFSKEKSKEKFFEAFQKNYMDLIRRIATGLKEEEPVVVAAINRTLYNQKDFFLCERHKIVDPPRFPVEFYLLGYGNIITNNGYEYLAVEFLELLPIKARRIYLERYKNDQNKLLDLQIVSHYYRYVVKDLGLTEISYININSQKIEKDLNNFLDVLEKATKKEENRKIMEAWL